MTKIINQFINSASTTDDESTSEWYFQVVELEDTASYLSEGKVLYRSPRCESKEECEEYKEQFKKERLNKDA